MPRSIERDCADALLRFDTRRAEHVTHRRRPVRNSDCATPCLEEVNSNYKFDPLYLLDVRMIHFQVDML